jgi:hypothetical protein
MAASARIGQGDQVLRELKRLAANSAVDVRMSGRLQSCIADLEKSLG